MPETDLADRAGTSVLGARARSRPRSLAPDVARGVGMAGVAVVNAVLFVPATTPVHTWLDAALHFAATLLLQGRSWPLFAIVFGWGVAATASSLTRRGMSVRDTKQLLRRRNWWLICFGLVQSLLFFSLDILGMYGATAMILLALLQASSRTWWVVGFFSTVPWLATELLVVLLLPLTYEEELGESSDYLWSVLDRGVIFGISTVVAAVTLVFLMPMLVGLGLHRSGALQHPRRHVRLHRRLVAWGLLLGTLGGAPHALVEAGWWTPDPVVAGLATSGHALTGVAQGVAYVSLIALWVVRREECPSVATRLLAAVGRRSLTVYLLHALLLALTLAPWSLDLTTRLSLAGTYAVGLGVWGLCALVAIGLHVVGAPGPADAALRRLTYRKRRDLDGGALGWESGRSGVSVCPSYSAEALEDNAPVV